MTAGAGAGLLAAGLLLAPANGAAATATEAGAGAAPQSAGDQILGGWFGNWHTPDIVADRMSAGSKSLTDAAVFAWAFGGAGNPVCALSSDNSCRPAGVVATRELRKSLRAMKGSTRWVSHIDLSASRARQLAAVIKNPRQRRALTTLLTRRTVALRADGLDLDWENFAFNDGSSTWASTRPALNRTVRQLARKLHAAGKLLSVTVPVGYAPLAESGTPRRGGGYTVFDWKRLAAAADRLNLMAYDYSFSSAGPIGPHGWARSAAVAARRSVRPGDARKVIVGVPLYGKSWPNPGPAGQAIVGSCPNGWRPNSVKSTFSVGALAAAELAEQHGVTPRFDRRSGEMTFTYSESVPGRYSKVVGKGKRKRTVARSTTCSVSRTVWFGNSRSFVKRARMAKRQGIGGVFAWNLASAEFGRVDRYTLRAG
jgi:hypothetical protein